MCETEYIYFGFDFVFDFAEAVILFINQILPMGTKNNSNETEQILNEILCSLSFQTMIFLFVIIQIHKFLLIISLNMKLCFHYRKNLCSLSFKTMKF
jgi:hypothetical protein